MGSSLDQAEDFQNEGEGVGEVDPSPHPPTVHSRPSSSRLRDHGQTSVQRSRQSLLGRGSLFGPLVRTLICVTNPLPRGQGWGLVCTAAILWGKSLCILCSRFM